MAKKSDPAKPLVLDATGDARFPVNLVLEKGSPKEMKLLLRRMGDAILSTQIPMLHDIEREWLGTALLAIGRGKNPALALRLKQMAGDRTPTGVLYDLHLLKQIDGLVAQGATQSEALSLIASHNVRERVFEQHLMQDLWEEHDARRAADALGPNDAVGTDTVAEATEREVERLKKQLKQARAKFPDLRKGKT